MENNELRIMPLPLPLTLFFFFYNNDLITTLQFFTMIELVIMLELE